MSDQKLETLPEGKEHYVKVGDIAPKLGCDIRHIYYAIRKDYIDSVQLTDSKYVDPEETTNWYNNRNTKRGRTSTRDSASLDKKFGVKKGTLLHTVVEFQRRIEVVEDVKEHDESATVVKKKDLRRKKDPYGGFTYILSQKLHDHLRSGEVTAEEDNFVVLKSLARSFELQGKEELAKTLYSLYDQYHVDEEDQEDPAVA